ncbi:acyl-CoA dehydrogenase family protein [Amycolatopsis sp. FDAARGOS 1241]|uniref:acyl-CoA dehydrogenase family protein n=1 Tax=Amycolatopsis sp. FDAARGOS 1241 TaxID=2778070 RepID=UPI001952856C|nr:acyl-CoA dehydrogenase family protein [Amycolatopsis sp. FDAARGOS 1241]QRP50205.1 acyl-CoA dehydrogenase family protein [Amycolatopsis sp. FDAARGOS 1241]
MDFSLSPQATERLTQVRSFMEDLVYPAEPVYAQQREELIAAGRTHDVPRVLEELIAAARERGLWNLFLPDESHLTNVDYAVLAEETGRSPFIAPAAMNCLSPDSGNMELLHLFATDDQRERWLKPLLDGAIRSGFSMTEPDVASSDATNISTSIVREGDEYVINGRKWFTTGAADPRCRLLIVLGQSDPDAPKHRRHSMVLVPIDTPGVKVERALPVFGFRDQQGHCEITYTDVRVPVSNLLGEQGGGFAVAQARLGPGRIHHCMRAVGMAERALELACKRALSRTAFGGPLADQGVVRQQIAESRMEIEQARLLVLRTAWLIDEVGVRNARSDIAAIKIIAPRAALNVLDRSIQIHGGAGVTDDLPLAEIWSRARTLRIVDGPDEVHIRTVARQELKRYQAAEI